MYLNGSAYQSPLLAFSPLLQSFCHYSHQDATKSSSNSEIGIVVDTGEDSNFDEHGSAGAVNFACTPTMASISCALNLANNRAKLQATMQFNLQLMWGNNIVDA